MGSSRRCRRGVLQASGLCAPPLPTSVQRPPRPRPDRPSTPQRPSAPSPRRPLRFIPASPSIPSLPRRLSHHLWRCSSLSSSHLLTRALLSILRTSSSSGSASSSPPTLAYRFALRARLMGETVIVLSASTPSHPSPLAATGVVVSTWPRQLQHLLFLALAFGHVSPNLKTARSVAVSPSGGRCYHAPTSNTSHFRLPSAAARVRSPSITRYTGPSTPPSSIATQPPSYAASSGPCCYGSAVLAPSSRASSRRPRSRCPSPIPQSSLLVVLFLPRHVPLGPSL